jgi:iron complex transport system permease protein
VLGLLGVLLIAMAMVSISVGAADVPLARALRVLANKLGADLPADARAEAIIWSIRLPRTAMAGLVGAGLASAGAAMQGLFRNPLADPGLIGVSSGAAAGAVVALVAQWFFAPVLGLIPQRLLVPTAAFLGGLGATWLVYRIATRNGRTSVSTMLLAGIAINAAAGALIGLLTYAADDAELRDVTLWTLGSVASADWASTGLVAVVCASTLYALWRRTEILDAFTLGADEARLLGVDTQRFQRVVITFTAVMVGACVAFTGLIGFVGLVAPHMIRLWRGPSHRTVIPGAALMGAILLIAADTAARTVIAPAELPIGVLTSLLGAPFFLALLVRRRGGHW